MSIKIFNGKEAYQNINSSELVITLDDNQREKLQLVLYEMYKDILELSKEINITPFLVGGSALGAIRHNAIIPWDDDLDVGFVREEYITFIESFSKKYSNKYIVNSPCLNNKQIRARFTKIIKTGTKFKEIVSISDSDLNGVFIDIFPIENVPNNKLVKCFKGITSDIIAYISSQVFSWENRNKISSDILKKTGMFNFVFRRTIGVVFSFINSSKWFRLFDKVSQYNHCGQYYTIASGRKHYFGEVIKCDYVFPPKYVLFGEFYAPVFNNVESYLTNMYGDYMKIPSVEHRESHMLIDFYI